MSLTKRQISKIMSREHNKKTLEKGFAYYYLRGLIFIAILVPLFSIPAFRADSPWYGCLFVAFALLVGYSILIGLFWGFVSVIYQHEKKAVAKMNIGRATYEKVVQENSRDRSFTAQVHDNLIKTYQVERLQTLPAFQVYENPKVYEKIRALLGWKELDKTQKESKRQDALVYVGLGALLVYVGFQGPSDLAVLTWIIAGFSFLYALLPSSIGEQKIGGNRDSRSIYTAYLHYWNKHFLPIYGESRNTLISFEKRHVFDVGDTQKINYIASSL